MSGTQRNSADRIAGQAYGAMFFAGFGSLWLLMGFGFLHQLNCLVGALVLVILFALLLPALCLGRRAAANRPAGPATAIEAVREREVERTFHRVNAAQYVAIPLVILGMNLLHRPEWIAAGIAVVVGLHLFPLARLFGNPTHNITGSALVVYAFFCIAALPRAAVASSSAFGTAAILLLSATYTLLRSRALSSSAGMQLA